MTALEHETTHEGEPELALAPPQHDNSVIGRLRARRDAVARVTTVDIDVAPIVTSDGEQLVARYRLLDVDTELEQIGKRIEKTYQKNPQRGARQAILDSLIAACEGFYLRDLAGNLVPLEQATGIEPELGPITYSDPRLGTALGFTADSARNALFEVFGGQPKGVLPALNHAQEYDQWASGATIDVDEETTGEA